MWTVREPARITLDGEVSRLSVALVAGRLNVVGSDGPARVEVASAGRRPITVRHEQGVLSVRHEHVPKLPGIVWWLTRLGRRYRCDVSVALPGDRPVEVSLVSGAAGSPCSAWPGGYARA